ncbi:hypothetical protein [Botryobacter ruber]|uniref:hypothetical protein n=1 Tax=Botryobacter ruber TaxID=2171629 RepID=UPI000E0AE9A3|nr:hypothetical protein [Botryobacter ruber]
MKKLIYYENAKSLFLEIEAEFSYLHMDLELNPKYVDLSLDIPKQPGLDFGINLNLQTDELFISTELINCSWFPIKDAQVCDMFMNAVRGIIKGEYRILQLVRNENVSKAILQKPINGIWETVCTDSMKSHFPWETFEKREIKNSLSNNV